MTGSTPTTKRPVSALSALLILVLASSAFASTPPEISSCSYDAGTGEASIAWVNNDTYSQIQIEVEGGVAAVLPGTATFHGITGLPPGNFVVCVVGIDGAGGEVLPLSCCDIEVTPPPGVTDLLCDPIDPDMVALAWSNGGAYTQIEVHVNGSWTATLPGSATFHTVTGLSPGLHTICVVPFIANTAGPESCCEAEVGPASASPISGLLCDPMDPDMVAVVWTNGAAYDEIQVSVDGVPAAVVAGADEMVTLAGLTPGSHTICVVGVIGGVEVGSPVCCTISLGAGAVSGLSCGLIPGTADLQMSWTNGGAYGALQIIVDGALFATLPGGATSFVVPGLTPGGHAACVRPMGPFGPILPEACCQFSIPGGGAGISPIQCAVTGADSVTMTWTNNGPYTQIQVILDGTLIDILPGTATSWSISGISSGGHSVCLRALIGSSPVPPDACCAFALAGTPIAALLCDPIFGTTDVALAWTNPQPYDSICVRVNGVDVATLSGSATFTTVIGLGVGVHEICVIGKVAGVEVGPEACCEVDFTANPISPLLCDPIFGTTDVALAWTNPQPFDSICVEVDGAVVAVLPGTATFTTAAALGAGIHEICVIGKIGGIEVGPPACCTVGFALPGPITGVTCFPIVGAVGTGVSWANDGLYDAIEVVVDGSIVAVLPGNSTTTVLPQLTGWTSVCLVPWVGNLAIEPIDCCENPTLEQTFIRADVNFDGGFDISDAIALLTFLFSGGMAPPCEDAADVNDDAAINVGDAIYALSTLFTGGAPPPAPFPACGADPTADGLGCAIFPPCP